MTDMVCRAIADSRHSQPDQTQGGQTTDIEDRISMSKQLTKHGQPGIVDLIPSYEDITTTVLLVGDDSDFAASIAEYLETEHGLKVPPETDPERALEILDGEQSVSCVVSDYAMPVMDGLEFLQAVREAAPDLPFVMFAGEGSEEVASEAIRLGADDYLKKGTGETRHERLATRIDNCVTAARKEQRLQNIYAAIENAGHAVTHELRNPLTVVQGRLDKARNAEDPTEVHTEIQAVIDRMKTLIDELFALAKHGKSVLDPEPASLEAVASDAWDHVDTRGMDLNIAADASLLMDKSRVTRLMENLFRNAREHACKDPTTRVDVLDDGNGFYIKDDGPGIPEEDRDEVFKSGFTTSEEGTGFGLAIVHQIADAHDWQVTITDGRDGGARFEFYGIKEEVIGGSET